MGTIRFYPHRHPENFGLQSNLSNWPSFRGDKRDTILLETQQYHLFLIGLFRIGDEKSFSFIYVDPTFIHSFTHSFIQQLRIKLCHCGCCRKCKDGKKHNSVILCPGREI